MEAQPPPTPKKPLGPLAWIGIGCGGIILLGIIAVVIGGFVFGGRLKEFAQEAEKNPTRATATVILTMAGDKMELVAEDDVNKRYTIREKATGKLTTIYWSEKNKAPLQVSGDFSSIPNPEEPPAAPVEDEKPAPPSGDSAPALPEKSEEIK